MPCAKLFSVSLPADEFRLRLPRQPSWLPHDPTSFCSRAACTFLPGIRTPASLGLSFPALLPEPAQVGTQSATKPSRSLSTVGAYSARITDIPRPQEVSSYKPHCLLCENRAVNWASSARPMVCGDGRLRNISLTGAKLRVRCSVGSDANSLPFYCRSWSDLPRWPAFLPMSLT